MTRPNHWNALRTGLFTSVMALVGCAGNEGTGVSSGGAVVVQISGEQLATSGFLFPDGSEVVMADGWQIELSHLLVTVGEATLSENPDLAPADASRTGRVVARASGPWAVDLHREGSVKAVGGEGTAVPLAEIASQTESDGRPFAADERYALGYSIVTATEAATRVNFAGDAEAEAAYADMTTNGYSVLYVGTATFRGESCKSSDDSYDFAAVPTTVPFSLGFQTPTDFVNCQNQENQGKPFPDEEYQRGVAVPANANATAQITLHADHPFYSDVQHEPSLYFGQMAARLVGKPEGARLEMSDLVGVDPTAFTDGSGAKLPWRVCTDAPLPEGAQMGFETGSIPVDPSATPARALRDYRDFVQYVQSTQGHMNGGEGLCFPKRRYPSPG